MISTGEFFTDGVRQSGGTYIYAKYVRGFAGIVAKFTDDIDTIKMIVVFGGKTCAATR